MAQVLALIDEITPLLVACRFDAVIRFRELTELLAGTAAADEAGAIGGLLAAFRFDLASERLQRLAARRDWQRVE